MTEDEEMQRLWEVDQDEYYRRLQENSLEKAEQAHREYQVREIHAILDKAENTMRRILGAYHDKR